MDDSDVGVGVNKWPDPHDPHPGQELHYHIDYWSDGNAATGPVWLTDTLPLSTTFVRWEEEWGWGALWTEVITTGGQFVLHAPAGIPGWGAGRIRLTLLLDADVPLGTRLTNHVEVATPQDDHPDNNTSTTSDSQASEARYDLYIHKNSNGGNQTPGGDINYWLHYHNQGNVAVHTWLTDTLPLSTTYRPGSARWCDSSGCTSFEPVTITEEYIVWDLGIVGVGQGQDFSFDVDIDLQAPSGSITNCATVGSAYPESTPEDNVACVVDAIYPPGLNLRVTKGHEWHGDGRLSYWIEVQNIGDVTVDNVVVTDTYPVDTTFNGEWWEEGWRPFNLSFTDNYTDSQLLWELEQLESGWGWSVRFNVDLDHPGEPLRWYTNTVQVTLPPGDPSPGDNVYVDVAFSGGEVQWVDFDVYRLHVRGCGYSAPVTVTTAITQMVFWDSCWDEHNFPDTFDPGDIVTVLAGAGTQLVVITIPDPFTAYASSITNTVWGQIDALDHEHVEVQLWGFPSRWTTTDDNGHYSLMFPNVPRGAQGDVSYWTEIDYAWVGFLSRFQTPDLTLNINYDHDWVEGNYEAGHTVWLTVTDSLGVIRATAELTTGVIPGWGGQTGFSTNLGDPWRPQRPDIQPGDWVHGATETGYTATVEVGLITGFVDVGADQITGTVDASWLMPGPIEVQCHPWGAPGGAPHREDWITPDGSDVYSCAWDPHTEWDVEPGQDIAVIYREPDGHQVMGVFRDPVPHLRVEKWLTGGEPGEGGNVVFHVQYRNEGDGDAENVVIT
ncbi:MAG TPA: hypothetical protein ENN19_11660, partial [Chloroflexi bacterium]|nr:hypothetical protein [Chloroflexota bacterium]